MSDPEAPLPSPPAPADGAAADPQDACLQCGTALAGPYCHTCGQHVSVAERVTFRSLWTDFRVRKLSLDRGFLRTLVDVVLRPGAVARAFVEGRRQTYTHPITLLFVAYAGYAVVYAVLGDALNDMIRSQIEAQSAAQTAGDTEAAAATAAFLDAMMSAFGFFYTYGAYFAVLIIVPFGLAARWLLGDRGRTVAECAVLGAYVEVAVVLPSMLVITPLAVAIGSHNLTSLSFVLYLVYAAWGGVQFFDGRWSSGALAALSMVIGLFVYLALFAVVGIGYGIVVGFNAAHAAG